MGQLETNLKNKHDSTLTRWQRLWRINSGKGWIGKLLSKKDGIAIIQGAQPFHGAPAGFPDEVGFDSIVVTPDMVGRRVAVFVGVELKATKNDKLSKEQRDFKKLIVDLGGQHREVRHDTVIESGFLSE